jgi:ABC-2 type transport system permease protein
MLRHILAFELRQQFSNPVLWIVAVVFALLAFGASSSDAVRVGGAIGNVWRNAPTVVIALLNGFAVFSMLLVVIFVAGGALRDFDTRTAELFFTTPVKKRDYLLGRFLGGYLATVGVMVCVAIGILLGTLMPWLDPERLGPTSLVPYAWTFGVLLLPNLLFVSAMLFCLAVTTRSMLATYIGVIAFFAISIVTGTLTADLDTRWIGALIDPFGQQAISDVTRYWSADESNTQLPAFDGVLVANRLLWTGIALLLVWLSYRLFRTDREGLSLRLRRRRTVLAAGGLAAPVSGTVAIPKVALQATPAAQWRQFLHQAWFDTRGVLKGVPLLVMLVIGLFVLVTNLYFGDQMFGTTIYPTTGRMNELIGGSLSIFLLIIVTFYAGELVFRERAQRIAEVTDAYPNADWIPLAAKATALTAVTFAFYAVGIIAGLLNQLVRGYYNVEIDLYLQQMLLTCVPAAMTGVLAMFLMVAFNNKAVGYLLMLVYIASRIAFGLLDLDNFLYRPLGAPPLTHSDMNGFGHFLIGHLWFRAYWGAFIAALFVLGLLLWVRGNRASGRERLREARRRLNFATGSALAVSLLAFVGIGAFIYYNTMVLASRTRVDPYLPGDRALDRQAVYETTYAGLKGLPQPKISDVHVGIDLYPTERRVDSRIRYRVHNPHDEPIAMLHLEILPAFEQRRIELGGATVARADIDQGVWQYTLDQPLQPGEERDFEFELRFAAQGFSNSRGQTQIVDNGSFINSGFLPSFGYNERRQIIDRNERRKRDLGEVPRMAKIDDESARQHYVFGDDADWITFETIVSTDPDQIALAPGYLQGEWNADGRRYFHYKMDAPMVAFAAWLSARWEVRRDRWNDVAIEVYYHPAHHWNVDRMIEASQKSFDYFTREFTPYQFRQLRILEFPRYESFAQSFANTVPYSESIGFIADLRDKDAIDYVFYVTAHEVAHQWWGHQVIGANQQGSTMLIESLAQYSALMVMEKEYGPQRMRQFLKYELDGYLRGRGGELIEELPLSLVENQQYIHYRKGSLVFYALRDAIGEDALNAVLRRFLQDKAFQSAPYTNTREFLAYLREGTDPRHHGLIEELFERIVFYDNRVTTAQAELLDDGRYKVRLVLHSAKFEADGRGKETALALGIDVDIGVFARPDGGKEKDETVLYLQKHRIDQQTTTLEIIVDGKPFDAGIDPYNKLIDRVSDDNRRKLSL